MFRTYRRIVFVATLGIAVKRRRDNGVGLAKIYDQLRIHGIQTIFVVLGWCNCVHGYFRASVSQRNLINRALSNSRCSQSGDHIADGPVFVNSLQAARFGFPVLKRNWGLSERCFGRRSVIAFGVGGRWCSFLRVLFISCLNSFTSTTRRVIHTGKSKSLWALCSELAL